MERKPNYCQGKSLRTGTELQQVPYYGPSSMTCLTCPAVGRSNTSSKHKL